MKKQLFATILLISFFTLSFNSCAVINSLLGIEETCAYAGCYNEATNGKYCLYHSGTGEIPVDLEKKADKAINKSLEKYREEQKAKKAY